ncbi:hypothetical protein [Thiolapillus sp.]
MHKFLLGGILGSLLISGAVAIAAAPFVGKTPQQLCAYMKDMGVPGSDKYRDQGDGEWSCGSTRKKLPQGEPAAASDLQYRVLGSETQPRKQILELRMRSDRQPQGVLKVFSRYVDVLLEKTLGSGITKDMYRAIMAPVGGEWKVAGHKLKLEKLRSKGSVYDLRFTVQLD